MKINKLYLLLLAASLITVAALTTYSGKNQETSGKSVWQQQLLEFQSQFPIADYDAPLPSSPDLLTQRQARGQRYDGLGYVSPRSDVNTGSTHWANGIAALPVNLSDLVITGLLIDSNAFLSNDKGAVYSEFRVEVEEALFNKKTKQFAVKEEITISRQGGRVRFSSGKVSLFYNGGQGMPRAGNRYVLFLKHLKDKDFEIITGYQIKDNHIFPLDYPGGNHPFTKFDGFDESSFFIQVRAAVSSNRPK